MSQPAPPLRPIVGWTYADPAIPWSARVELLACGHTGKHIRRHLWKLDRDILARRQRRCAQCAGTV